MTVKKSSFTDDDLGFVQLAPTAVLAAVARGELDLNALARRTLADRGLDRAGKWVGFGTGSPLARGCRVTRKDTAKAEAIRYGRRSDQTQGADTRLFETAKPADVRT